MSNSSNARHEKPKLPGGALKRNPSYLDDHLEYRPRQSGPITSIDGVIEQLNPPLTNLTQGLHSSPVLSPRRSIAVIEPSPVPDQAIIHDLTHTNCTQEAGSSTRLVATIFYNSAKPQHAHPHPDNVGAVGSTSHLPVPAIAEGLAPTTKLADFPLEPPVPEPEPLDHLYGSYISQACLTHFLATLDSLLVYNPPDQRRLISTHRCLASDSAKPRVMEVTFSPGPDPGYLSFRDLCKHESVYRFEREWNCEVIFQQHSVHRRHKRLVVFDMDSTLIQQEVIDEIAAFIGVQTQVSEITERAMNGELDFTASLRARVALLKGVPSDVFEKLKPKIVITPGARELCKVLKRLGCTLAVLSGGFQPLADWLARELGLDHAFANHLVSDPASKTLTGELEPGYPIVNAEHKKNLLISLAKGKGIKLEQTMAVGDGANDLPMLVTSGLGVALKAKPKVQMEAPARLNVCESMLDLIYLLGFTQAEVKELLQD